MAGPRDSRTTAASRPARGKLARAGRIGGFALRSLTVLLVYGTLFAVTAVAGLVIAALPELPKIEGSSEFRQVEGTVYARDGRTVLRTLRAPTSRSYLGERKVPGVLSDAVVAAEDHRFYDHRGIDVRGIARAALVDLRSREIREGGSTITQQLVKNAYVGPSRTFARKSREALLALALDSRWSKRRIMAAYLNTSYFGEGAYGVKDAAHTYFGRPVGDLNLAQAALLAGLLRAPAYDNPVVAPGRARARRHDVLTAMLKEGFIDERRFARADAAAIPSARDVRARSASQHELAPHFTDEVVGELIASLGVARTLGGGIRVTTTLDPKLQRAARAAVRRIDGVGPSAALVAIDPRRGEIRALALGGPAARRAFDPALHGERQPGSAFKVFTLVTAFERGYTPSTRMLSAPFRKRYPGSVGVWKVTNGSGLYAGRQELEQATWYSDNTVFARLADRLGIESVLSTARELGIRARIEPYPSAALGALSTGVSPTEMATAYATIANHGRRVTGRNRAPLTIRTVRDHGRHVLLEPEAVRTRVVPRVVADLVTSVLEGVIERGTGTAAALGRPAAGKTGTTDANVDAWFVGYTPGLVAAVWVGYPDAARPMQREYHGEPVVGGSFPAEIWAAFMGEADRLRLAGGQDFHLGEMAFVTVTIDPVTRLLADEWCARRKRERFLEGLQPTRLSTDCPTRMRPAPNVVAMTRIDAERLLTEQDFPYEVRESLAASTSPAGTVITQIPAPGGLVTRNGGIKLVVATGDARESHSTTTT